MTEKKTDIKPLGCYLFIEPITKADQFRKEMSKRSGLLMPEPKFQGVPNMGIVRYPNECVHDGVKDDVLKEGMVVVFEDEKPSIVEIDGNTLFAIARPRVIAIIEEETNEKNTD